MAIIAERINKAKTVVAFPAFTISRLGLQSKAQKAIEAIGCPFVTTLMEKCMIDEGHPQFAGMYAGAASDPKARQIAEGADLVLDLGGVNLNDSMLHCRTDRRNCRRRHLTACDGRFCRRAGADKRAFRRREIPRSVPP